MPAAHTTQHLESVCDVCTNTVCSYAHMLSPNLVHIDRPSDRFAVRVLTALCEQSEGQPLAGVVVIGDGNSARAVAMAGSSMGLPVLWAKGGTANLDGMHREASQYDGGRRRECH